MFVYQYFCFISSSVNLSNSAIIYMSGYNSKAAGFGAFQDKTSELKLG